MSPHFTLVLGAFLGWVDAESRLHSILDLGVVLDLCVNWYVFLLENDEDKPVLSLH